MDVNTLVQVGIGVILFLLGILVRQLNASMVRMQIKVDALSDAFAAITGRYIPREELDARFKDSREDYHKLRNQVGDLRTDHEILRTRIEGWK